jgi:metal-dependent amidase/aminoacylase/carboxypeptidase family protein
MPVLNRIASYAEDMKGWRRHLHMHPELAFDCHKTAAYIVDRLRDIGVDEIHEGIAQTRHDRQQPRDPAGREG